MKSCDGIECDDRRQVTMHGKGMDDSDGLAMKGMVKDHLMMTMGKDQGTLSVTWPKSTLLQTLNAIHATIE